MFRDAHTDAGMHARTDTRSNRTKTVCHTKNIKTSLLWIILVRTNHAYFLPTFLCYHVSPGQTRLAQWAEPNVVHPGLSIFAELRTGYCPNTHMAVHHGRLSSCIQKGYSASSERLVATTFGLMNCPTEYRPAERRGIQAVYSLYSNCSFARRPDHMIYPGHVINRSSWRPTFVYRSYTVLSVSLFRWIFNADKYSRVLC